VDLAANLDMHFPSITACPIVPTMLPFGVRMLGRETKHGAYVFTRSASAGDWIGKASPRKRGKTQTLRPKQLMEATVEDIERLCPGAFTHPYASQTATSAEGTGTPPE